MVQPCHPLGGQIDDDTVEHGEAPGGIQELVAFAFDGLLQHDAGKRQVDRCPAAERWPGEGRVYRIGRATRWSEMRLRAPRPFSLGGGRIQRRHARQCGFRISMPSHPDTAPSPAAA